jgi:hypothetical protein
MPDTPLDLDSPRLLTGRTGDHSRGNFLRHDRLTFYFRLRLRFRATGRCRTLTLQRFDPRHQASVASQFTRGVKPFRLSLHPQSKQVFDCLAKRQLELLVAHVSQFIHIHGCYLAAAVFRRRLDGPACVQSAGLESGWQTPYEPNSDRHFVRQTGETDARLSFRDSP